MSQRPPPAERPPYLRFLPLFLFRPEGSRVLYVAKAWLLALIPSILISMLVNAAAPAAEQPDLPLSGPLAIGFITLLGPFLETLIMAGALLVLNRLVAPGPAAVLSALGWGLAHSWAAPIWGLIIWWPFLIFSIAFLAWRGRGFWAAILLVTAIHALQNCFAVALLLAGPLVAGFIDALTPGPI